MRFLVCGNVESVGNAGGQAGATPGSGRSLIRIMSGKVRSTYEAAELLNILEGFCSERCVQSSHRSIVSKSYSHQREHLAHSGNDAK